LNARPTDERAIPGGKPIGSSAVEIDAESAPGAAFFVNQSGLPPKIACRAALRLQWQLALPAPGPDEK
jgi:hypothetical protein